MRTTVLLLLYAAFAAFGTYTMFQPTFASRFASIQTERGDGVLNHLILENSWLALSRSDYCGSFITIPFCFPERGTIYYSENLFGSAPLYWALRIVLPYDLAYIWWQILLSACNFVAFAVVARWFRLPHVPAVCGAFLWAFAAVHMDQIKHQQMIGRLWMPFALYYAVALVTEPSRKAWNRLLGSTFLQCLTCFYTGWFLVVALGVFVPALVAMRAGAARDLWRFARENRGAVVRIAGFWALAMVALFVPYVIFSPSSGHEYKGCFGLMPVAASWITGSNGAPWIEELEPYSKPEMFECKLFCGFGVYALMLGAAVSVPFLHRDRHPTLRLLIGAGMLTAAVWWILTIATPVATPIDNPDSDSFSSLWKWVRFLPGGTAVRVVSRVYVVVYLFGTFAGLAWLHLVTERIPYPWARLAICAAICGAIIWEQTGTKLPAVYIDPDGALGARWEPSSLRQPSFERADFYPLVDRLADGLRDADVGVAYVVPRYTDPHGIIGNGPYGEVFGMWVGMRANVPVINGYSGVTPPDFLAFIPQTDDQLRAWLRGRYRGKGPLKVRVIDPDNPAASHEFVFVAE